MAVWTWRRWAWGVVMGVVMGAAMAAPVYADAPKAGDTITLAFPGQPERKVTVIKSTKQPDGTIETEVKDLKTGETFTILDEAPDAKPQTPPAGTTPVPPAPTRAAASSPGRPSAAPTPMPTIPASNREPILSRFFSGTDDKSPPQQPPTAAKAEPNERRFFGRLFSREKSEVPAMTAEAPASREERRGLLNRIFGRKPEPTPAQPGVAVPAPAMQAPPRGLIAAPPSTSEPPRVMPPRPMSPPTTPRSTPPTPVVPAIPAPLPAIPAVPGSPPLSYRPAQHGVVQASYRSSAVARAQEVQPYATALANDPTPSARMMAARALALGRHASSDEVKSLLFQTAQTDPCPAVRADCIGHLCKLGYYHPAFLSYLQAACDDMSEEVRNAAHAASAKMLPKSK